MALFLEAPVRAQHVVGPAEGLACEPSATHLNGLAPHLHIALAYSRYLSVLCPVPLVGRPNAVISGNGEFQAIDLL